MKELEAELSELKSSFEQKESGLKSTLAAETSRAEKAEKNSEDLQKEVDLLKNKLAETSKDVVISEFKNSAEYDLALANAGAPEIQRCWIIAEKHIKTDPNANWGSFIDEFLAAKKDIEEGKGEPESFDGPSPSFLPAAPNTSSPELD